MIRELKSRSLRIPFKQSFKHASAQRDTTQTLWVEAVAESGIRGFGEGCPREYVTGESVESALAFIRSVESDIRQLNTLDALRAWTQAHRHQIDASPAAWCAIELAVLDVLARAAGQSVEALLALPPIAGPFHYSAVLGAAAPAVFEPQLRRYLEMGFRDFKVKLSGTQADMERVALLKQAAPVIKSLRFDANNLWTNSADAIAHLQHLDVPFFAIEEPLMPGDYTALARIATALELKIILDESLLRIEQLDHLAANPELWIVNLRVSKMGGLLRSLAVANRAAALGIPLIIGCQVGETSLLTRAALSVAQSHAGNGLLAQEGAFGTLLLARDVVDPPLMFGHGGQLDVTAFAFGTAAGFGLEPAIAPG